jgi:hypothetical protein
LVVCTMCPAWPAACKNGHRARLYENVGFGHMSWCKLGAYILARDLRHYYFDF